jgi:hypothetical protein
MGNPGSEVRALTAVRGADIKSPRGGTKLREMMDLEVWKLHHEELMRDVTQMRRKGGSK